MFLWLQVHAAPGRVPHGACAHVSSAGCCRGPGAAWGTQRPPLGSQTGNGSGEKLFYLQSGSSFDWEPCVAWSRRETGRQVTAWLRCFLKRAQLKIPEGFLRPCACAWGPAASSPAPAPVCTVLGGVPAEPESSRRRAGAWQQGRVWQSKPQRRENTCSLPGTERGSSSPLPNVVLSSPSGHFPFVSSQITFQKTQQ